MSAAGARGGPPAIAAAAVCLSLAGCDLGGDDQPPAIAPGALAAHVPSDAFVYVEGVVRPDEDLSDAIDGAFEEIGAEESDRDEIGPELLESVADDFGLPAADDLDYDDDVRPWLGQRVAGFAAVPRAARQLARLRGTRALTDDSIRAAAVVAVADEDEARDALERALPEDDIEAREGTDLYFEQADTALALFDDRLVVGSPDSVEAVLDTDSHESLREREWFDTGMRTIDEPTSVAFMLIGARQAYELSPGGGGGRLGRLLSDPQLLADTGFNPDVPVGLELHAAGGHPTFELSYGVDGKPPLKTVRRLVEQLPADAWAVLGDPILTSIYSEIFANAFEVGFESELGTLSEAEARRATVAAIGYDAVEAFDTLGQASALYARGDDPSDLSAGLVIESDTSNPDAQPIDAARVVIASLLPRSPVRFRRPAGAPATRFSFRLPDPPIPVTVDQRESTLEMRLGSAPAAAGQTIGDTNRLDEVGERLGSPWQPLGEVDIGRLIDIAESFSGESDANLEALAQTTLDVGGRFENGVFTFRFQLSRTDD